MTLSFPSNVLEIIIVKSKHMNLEWWKWTERCKCLILDKIFETFFLLNERKKNKCKTAKKYLRMTPGHMS